MFGHFGVMKPNCSSILLSCTYYIYSGGGAMLDYRLLIRKLVGLFETATCCVDIGNDMCRTYISTEPSL